MAEICVIKSFRLTPELAYKLEELHELSGLSQSEIVRLSLTGMKTIKEKLATPLDIEDETDSIENEKDPAKLAKLVLEKSGRKKITKKKSLMEIAQGLNRFKDFEADENAENEKD